MEGKPTYPTNKEPRNLRKELNLIALRTWQEHMHPITQPEPGMTTFSLVGRSELALRAELGKCSENSGAVLAADSAALAIVAASTRSVLSCKRF